MIRTQKITVPVSPEIVAIRRELTTITEIAKKHFPNVPTLQVRRNDSLDFHKVFCESIRDALMEAYQAGADSIRNAPLTAVNGRGERVRVTVPEN